MSPAVLSAEREQSHLRFDGIVEGQRGDDAQLRGLVAKVNAAGLVHLDVDIDGGGFSLLPDDGPIDGQAVDERKRQAFAGALEELFAWASEQGELESTLRCTEMVGDEARETLFSSQAGALRVISRGRALQAEDRRQFEREEAIDDPIGWRPDTRVAAAILALVLVLAGIVTWQSGMIHRALAAESTSLQQEHGDFGSMVAMTVEQDWGTYRITLKRGEAYPATVDAVDALVAEAETTAERAAINAVANGQEVYCRLIDNEGRLLASRGASMRSLLTDPEASIEIILPGHMRAARLELAIDPGKVGER